MKVIQPYPDHIEPFDVNHQAIRVEWAQWLQNVMDVANGSGNTPRALTGTSPRTYTNTTKSDSMLLVSGGTVSSIGYSRDGTTYYSTGVTSGQIIVMPGDTVKVTYTTAPTTTIVER